MDAKQIKEAARRLGADAVAIGSIDRWEGCPAQMDPRFIMPRARSIIAMAFRVNRGTLRGIEEGTFFSNYSSMGYGGLTYLYMPMTVINLTKLIEDEGYEAIPYGHQSDWRAIDSKGNVRKGFSRPVRPGKPVPDVMVHLRIAAYLCGLGEIGYSKMFLTPEFGPRNRIGIVITEAEFEPDPIVKPGTLCNKCMACVRDCPGGCISKTKTVKQKLGGYDIEWGDIDEDRCDVWFGGAEKTAPGEVGVYMEGRPDMKSNFINPFFKKNRNLYNTGQAICGARGCTRACMISLETRGVLKNKFKNPFRTEKPWTMDWSPEAIANDKPAAYAAPKKSTDDVMRAD